MKYFSVVCEAQLTADTHCIFLLSFHSEGRGEERGKGAMMRIIFAARVPTTTAAAHAVRAAAADDDGKRME